MSGEGPGAAPRLGATAPGRRGRRLLGAFVATVVALTLGAVAVESWARSEHLDRLQGTALESVLDPRPPERMGDVSLTGVPWLPAGFALTERGFATAYGPCEPDAAAHTLLVLGDSTTVMSAVAGPPGGRPVAVEVRATWPDFLEPPPGWQLCVLAAKGWHPRDYVNLVQALGARLAPTLTVALLCENDLGPLNPREVVARDGGWRVIQAPRTRRVWRQLWSPGLYEASEAYRFATWRMAALTGDAVDLPAATPGEEPAPALAELSPRPHLLFLPRLRAPWGPSSREQEGLARFGEAVEVLPAPPDPVALRRLPDDEVHLDEQGHRWLAAEVQARLPAWIAAAAP